MRTAGSVANSLACTATGAGLENAVDLIDAAAAGDEAARDQLDSQTEDPFTEVNRQAREYGMTACGEEDT